MGEPPPGSCFYCGETGVPLVRDHFLPASLGGHDGPGNRFSACLKCDRAKGHLHPRDWLRVCPPQGTQRVLQAMKERGLTLDYYADPPGDFWIEKRL